MPTATEKRTPAKRAAKPKPTKPVVIELDGDRATTIFKAARIVATFASTDEARRVLCCVRLRCDSTSLRIEATDSYRLARIEMPARGLPQFEAIVNAKWLASVAPKHKLATSQRFTLTIGKRFEITDHATDTAASIAAYDGQYPNTTDKLFADNAEQPEMDGETPRGFDPKFLASVFKAAEQWGGWNNPLVVRHLDPLKPCFFEVHVDAGKLTMLLMPVRLA